MEYRYLGRTGLKVSELCLGAMTFGRESTEAESYQMLDHFQAVGGNFIDTADVYSSGRSETILGRWLVQRNREDLVIATKVRFNMGNTPNDMGLSRKHILAGIDASLKRLGTDYVDLYQIHSWDPGAPLEETLQTLDGLVRSGKVRYVGASNVAEWQLQKAIDISRYNGWEPFSCLQPLYNLLDREMEWGLVPVCLNEGVGIIPWSPLRGGWLSGKYHRGMDAPPEGTRVDEAEKQGWSESWRVYANERTWSIIETVEGLSSETGKSAAQIALNWLLQMPGVTAPIIGVRNLTHLKDNLGSTGWSLTAEQMKKLNDVSSKPLPYPYREIANSSRARAR
jgi:aryl-alcohol dehydrogenase-like predicted oxidoreductase